MLEVLLEIQDVILSLGGGEMKPEKGLSFGMKQDQMRPLILSNFREVSRTGMILNL